MTPRLADILRGCAVALSAPLPDEAGPEYAAGRQSIVGLLLTLAAQEAEHGAAAAHFENAAIAALIAEWGPRLGLQVEAAGADGDLTLTGLEAANARLRRSLTALHEAAEAAGERALERRILELYRDMAKARRLEVSLGG
ncbi:MAG TPA: hypothetical protein VGS12_12455 [Caulobacteraceae bacterium]|nr:hypothetical protein [Caulobacteraceae bacterium]